MNEDVILLLMMYLVKLFNYRVNGTVILGNPKLKAADVIGGFSKNHLYFVLTVDVHFAVISRPFKVLSNSSVTSTNKELIAH